MPTLTYVHESTSHAPFPRNSIFLLTSSSYRLIASIPPRTIEQSSNTASSLSTSSLSRKFSFFNNFASPVLSGLIPFLDHCAPLPRLISPLPLPGETLRKVIVSSSSAPSPESLHQPESSPSDCGLRRPSLLSEKVCGFLGLVISLRREACAWEVMSSCALSAEFEVLRSFSWSVRVCTVVWYVRRASVREMYAA